MIKRPMSDIPKYLGVYKELFDVDDIFVTSEGEIISNDIKIKPYKHEGYYLVSIKNKSYYIHRLVALLYVKNKSDNKVVFHINKNTLDNRCENLRWTNQSFVSISRRDFERPNRGKKVALVDNDMEILKIYKNGGEVSRELGINRSEVYRVCKGMRNHVGGYKFKYLDER